VPLVCNPSLDRVPSAEACFVRAIEIARGQGARALELRAALSVSRLWRKHGRETDARQILLDVCGGFPQELDTLDLREAQALLNEMPAQSS
jgi:predicted ATPase